MSDDKPENTNEGTGDVPPPDIPPPPVPEADTPPPAPEVSKESAGEEPPPAPPKTEPQEQGGGMPPASSEKTMGMASHLLSFCGFVIPYIGSLLGPLVLWFLKKDQSKAVRDEGRKSVSCYYCCFDPDDDLLVGSNYKYIDEFPRAVGHRGTLYREYCPRYYRDDQIQQRGEVPIPLQLRFLKTAKAVIYWPSLNRIWAITPPPYGAPRRWPTLMSGNW